MRSGATNAHIFPTNLADLHLGELVSELRCRSLFSCKQSAIKNIVKLTVSNETPICQTDNPKRLFSLDGLRGIAAIAVMMFHFNIFFLPQARLPFSGRAYLAVDLFFLLSGFVMVHVYGRELASNRRAHWPRFITARFARIYPLFAVTTLVIVIVFVISPIRLNLISFSTGSLSLQPFMLQQWYGLSWNYPSWSISTEAEAYICFIFSAQLLVNGRYPWLMGACCVAMVISLCIVHGQLNLCSGISALLRTVAEFSFGALLYRAHVRYVRSPRLWAAILACLLVAIANITQQDFLIVGAFACLIYYAVNATDALGKLLNSPPLVALGNWSYSIYLWHVPIHYGLMTTLTALGYSVSNLSSSSARLMVLATALGVIGLSALSYQYFETPMRRAIMRYGDALDRLWRRNLIQKADPGAPRYAGV